MGLSFLIECTYYKIYKSKIYFLLHKIHFTLDQKKKLASNIFISKDATRWLRSNYNLSGWLKLVLNLCVLKACSQGLWPKACEPSFVTQAYAQVLWLKLCDSIFVTHTLCLKLCNICPWDSCFVSYACIWVLWCNHFLHHSIQ